MAIFSGRGWAALLGVLMAGLNAVAQQLFIRTFPVWSSIVIGIDLLIIYGLVTYGRARRSLD